MTLDNLIKKYGDPVFMASFHELTQEQRMIDDIPEKVVVFKTNRTPMGIVIYGQRSKNEWLANYGHRGVIKKLLEIGKFI